MASEHWLQPEVAGCTRPWHERQPVLGGVEARHQPSLARKVQVAPLPVRAVFPAPRICRSVRPPPGVVWLALLGGVPQRLHQHVRLHLHVAVTKAASPVDPVDPAPPASPSSVASSPLSLGAKAHLGLGGTGLWRQGRRAGSVFRPDRRTFRTAAVRRPRPCRPCVRWSSARRFLQELPATSAAWLCRQKPSLHLSRLSVPPPTSPTPG